MVQVDTSRVGIGLDRMAPPDPLVGPRWFPGARLNFAENLLRAEGPATAIVSGRRLNADGTSTCLASKGGSGANDTTAIQHGTLPTSALLAAAAVAG